MPVTLLRHFPFDLLGAPAEFGQRLTGSLLAPPFEQWPQPSAHFDRIEREALGARLLAAIQPGAPHVAVLDALRELEDPRSAFIGVAVRPSLLGPRLADLLAALHAVTLARAARARTGRPVHALLWIACDEHSIGRSGGDEATPIGPRAHFEGPHHDLLHVSLPGIDHEPRPEETTLSSDTSRLGALRAHLRALFHDAPHRDRAFELCLPREGESLCTATARMLFELFGSAGAVVLGEADLRSELATAFAGLLDDAARLPERTVVAVRFLAGERRIVRPGREGFVDGLEPGSWTPVELAGRLVVAPAEFAPGSALLPAVLARVLPLAAWLPRRADLSVASSALAGTSRPANGGAPGAPRAIGAPGRLGPGEDREAPPLLLPRLEATLVETALLKAARRAGATESEPIPQQWLSAGPPDCPEVEDEVLTRAIRGLVELRERAAEFQRELARLARPVIEADPSLGPVWKRQAGRSREALSVFEGSAERALRNRAGTAVRHRRHLATVLRPGGRPQGEVHGALALFARSGTGWLAELGEEFDPLGLEHLLVEVR